MNKAQERCKKWCIAEVESLGHKVIEVKLDGEDGASKLGAALQVTFGNKSFSPKETITYTIQGNSSKALYFESFDGVVALPGEFHCVIANKTPSSAVYYMAGWESEHSQLKDALNQALHGFMRKFKWQRGSPTVRVLCDLEWALQIRPVEGGTHIVMLSGMYQSWKQKMLTGGFTPGYSLFTEIVQILKTTLSEFEAGPTGSFIHQTREDVTNRL